MGNYKLISGYDLMRFFILKSRIELAVRGKTIEFQDSSLEESLEELRGSFKMDVNDNVSFYSCVNDGNEINLNTMDKSKFFQSCINDGNETTPNTLDKSKRFQSLLNDGNEIDANIFDTTLERIELKVASRLKHINSPASVMDTNSIQFVEEDITDRSSTVEGSNEENKDEPSVKSRDRIAVLHYILHLFVQIIWLMMIPLLFMFVSYLDEVPPSWN